MEYFFNVNTGRVEQRPINQQFYPGTTVPVATPFSNLGITAIAPTNTSPNIVDEARELNEALKRRTLATINFQDPYYLNTGIINQAPGRFLDNAGLPLIDTSFGVANEPDDPDDVEKAKNTRGGIASLFEFLSNIPTPLNLLRRGLESLSGINQKIRGTDFGQSKTLAEYFQKRRDRKAREDAAKRGADKQRIKNLRAFNEGAGQYFSGRNDGDSGRPGGFGQGAGGFSSSDPTATEGSF